MTETWRPIPGCPDYEVSDEGRVLSRKRYHGSTGPRILKLTFNSVSDYAQVGLPKGSGFSPRTVHSLVLLAFVGPRPKGHQVRHLDGNPRNNVLSNLAYGTPTENAADLLAHGRHPYASRQHCSQGHAYTPENTRIWHHKDRPFRQCVICHRTRRAAQLEKKRAAA